MVVTVERSAQSYGPGVTSASKAVLLELMTTLRAYQGALVLVGGWVPYLLLEQHRRPDDPFAHVGSIDIDLAVDPAQVQPSEYATIVELLQARGYTPTTDRRGAPILSSLNRTVASPVTAKPYVIRVDFLIPPDSTGSRTSKSIQVQDDLFARKTRGCEAAFRYQTIYELAGALPDGGELAVPVRMADVVGSLTMKGIVLGERYREKDAYDIYALAAHYQTGPAAVAEAIRPHLHDPLIAESLRAIQAAFGSRQANGPAWVANFLVSSVFAAERQRVITDAYMVVGELVRLLKT